LDYEGLLQRILRCHGRAKPTDARKLYQRVLREGNPRAQRYFGRVAIDYHEPALAEKLLGSAIRAGVSSPEVHNDFGIAQLGRGRSAEAVESFRAARAGAPDNAMFVRNLANALKETGALEEARAIATRGIGLDPANPVGHVELGDILLRTGEPQAALASLRRARDKAGAKGTTWALALEAIALSELGDSTGFRGLMDYEGLCHCVPADAPEGFADLGAFNARLHRGVARHRALTRAPARFATRNGYHTIGNLLSDPAPIFRAMDALIRSALDRYAAAIRAACLAPNHPFSRPCSELFRLEGWAVKLGEQGYQETHVHPDGWVSGVYYIDVDDVVSADDPDHQGWLELGRGPEHFYRRGPGPATQLVRPRPGCFVFFPSYFWHRTIPFSGARERVSFAFDVIPAEESPCPTSASNSRSLIRLHT